MSAAMVDIPGGRLATRLDGETGRPWLVLSNSLAADLGMWDAQMPWLAERYRVLRYDTRGHGGSTAPPGDYAFADLVADAIAVMDHHGIDRARYVGLSLGGMTGLGLALDHPGRIERLVVCDARADAPPPFVKGWDDRLAAIATGGLDAIVAGTLERWLTPAFRARDPAGTARLGAMIRATSPEGYRGCAAALKRLDYQGRLGTLAVPTLYVVGAEDVAAPEAAMRAMAEATPGGRLAVVPEAAHIANVDNPEGFRAAIDGFLA